MLLIPHPDVVYPKVGTISCNIVRAKFERKFYNGGTRESLLSLASSLHGTSADDVVLVFGADPVARSGCVYLAESSVPSDRFVVPRATYMASA